MDEHDRLPAAVQSGRCCGLLAQPEGGQQKTHRGGVCRVRAGAGAEQCLLCAQFQLLRTLVLYAHPHPCRHDRERAGGPDGRSGHPCPGHRLADAGNAGVCGSARAGRCHRSMVLRRAKKPGAVLCRAGLWSAGALAVPLLLPPVAAGPPLCAAHDGGSAGVCLRVQHGTHRHWQVWPVVHRQRPCGAG